MEYCASASFQSNAKVIAINAEKLALPARFERATCGLGKTAVFLANITCNRRSCRTMRELCVRIQFTSTACRFNGMRPNEDCHGDFTAIENALLPHRPRCFQRAVEIGNRDVRMKADHVKTTAITEEVSSHPEEIGHWSQKWRQNTSRAGQKVDWKNDLRTYEAGRKSQKPPAPVAGNKPNGKSQFE